jgi:cytidine deaminase
MAEIHQFEYYKSSSLSDFTINEQLLIKDTIKKAKNAYAPYSNFNVSSGILLTDTTILSATNVENASYPIGTCAERNVLSYCISNYPKSIITTIAVYAEKSVAKLSGPITPCGMCRQALLEAEIRQGSAIKLIMIGNDTNFLIVTKCADLLPFAFDGSEL